MKKILNKYQIHIVLSVLVTISFLSFLYFYQNGQNLLYGDALSRMDISRKIIDNLTPGLAQLGNVWLPLPQLLMLPFIWNRFLWHSGIAGAIMSMSAFVIGGLYLYKSARILSNSFLASFLSLSIYALNINLLYLQTTAMSESIFICTVIVAIYYFIKWIRSGNKMHYLIFAATAISVATLIRYEALSLLLSSIPMVFFYSWLKTKKYHWAEGNTILYAVLACLGFVAWTIYLWAIFGDPLFWKNYYAGSHVEGDIKTQLHIFSSHLSYSQAAWKYFVTMIWMNGLIPVVMAIFSIPVLIYESFKKKTWYFLPIFLSMELFIFMLMTMHGNTPINQPDLTLSNLLSPSTSKFFEFNMRYGLIMLPTISLLSIYLFKSRFLLIKILLGFLLLFQFASYFYPWYTIIYQLPVCLSSNIDQGAYQPDNPFVRWINNNYDGGLIMISALKHDPIMFQLGYNFKTYIHEGTGMFWKDSIKNPQKYAKWVIFDNNNKDDQVTKYLKDSPALKLYYNLVYENNGMKVYKIKTKPDVAI